MANTNLKKVEIKQKKQKELFIEQLKKVPIIQLVSERLDISRQTFYRWKRTDKKFSAECDKALEEGCTLINDLAESQLINAMKDKNLTAVMYWLNHRHNSYKNKLEVSGDIKIKKDELTKEEEKNIIRSLKLGSLVINNKGDKNDKSKQQPTRSEENNQEAII